MKLKLFSARAFEHLGALQTAVRRLAVERNLALRMFIASRNAATSMAQREFWLEFAWLDQEYRMAVRRLASFCIEYRGRERKVSHDCHDNVLQTHHAAEYVER